MFKVINEILIVFPPINLLTNIPRSCMVWNLKLFYYTNWKITFALETISVTRWFWVIRFWYSSAVWNCSGIVHWQTLYTALVSLVCWLMPPCKLLWICFHLLYFLFNIYVEIICHTDLCIELLIFYRLVPAVNLVRFKS